MASTVTVTCPECGKQLKAPPAVLGKKIRCKGCGHAFAARAEEDEPAKARASPPRGKAAPAKGPARPAAKAPAKPAAKPAAPAGGKAKDDEEEGGAKPNPYDVTTTSLAPRCPFCANELKSDDAVICLTCGYNTVTRVKGRTRKVRDVTGLDLTLWLLPGVACALGLILLTVFDILYCLRCEQWMDKEAWYGVVLTHYGFKIWLVIVSLFADYHMARFAILRLAINYWPPEIEEN
jgi:hypothetical protein